MLENVRISSHARFEMERRQITESEVIGVLSNPEQVLESGSGRKIFQSRMKFQSAGKAYLLRVVVDTSL